MRNCRDEFLQEIENKVLLCAQIFHGYQFGDEPRPGYSLPKNFTEEEYATFLKSINFEYDSGFGGQELYGIIWYKDKSWSERHEYDGSEWWEYKKTPKIPKDLNRKRSK